MSSIPTIRWEAPGRAPSAGPALAAGVLAAVFPIVATAVLAWWLARRARVEITASDGQLDGQGFVTATFVLAAYSILATASLIATGVS